MNIAEHAEAAVSVHKTEALLFFTLIQLTIIVLAARVGTAIAQQYGQSAAVGEIIVGILLGPSLFGWLAPDVFAYVFHSSSPEPLQILSQIGLILLMFQIGLEFDFSHLAERRNSKAVFWIALASLVAPFALGLFLGYVSAPILSPDANVIASSLFIATAFSITALPILGRIMIDFDMTRTQIGVIAISAAAINDVVGWLLLTLVTTLTLSAFNGIDFALKIAAVGAFMLLCWFLVRPLMLRVIRGCDVATNGMSNNLLGVVLAAVFVAAMATYQLGIFAIFGGFIMGVILHSEHDFVEAWKSRIGPLVAVFFLPIFFTYTGLRTDIGGLDKWEAWGWCALTIALATIGKFGGAYLSARVAGLNHNEANIMGIMMSTRALMELIVINVGFDLGVISQQVFTMLVIMALVSTIVTCPCLRIWLPRIGTPVKVLGTT